MNSPDPGYRAIEQNFTKDIKTQLGQLGPTLISSKMQQQKVLAESAANGGPTNTQGAIATLLDYAKIGMRELSRDVKVPRKRLLAMVAGTIDMPAEVITAIYAAIEKKRPGMMDRLKKLV